MIPVLEEYLEPHDQADEEALAEAPHAVVAAVGDLHAARALIEDLEEHGVPAEAIALLGAHPEDPAARPWKEESEEAEAFSDVTKSVVAGGAGGAFIGGVLGSLVTLVIPGVGVVLAAGLGAVYGAGVGGAAGGMSVAKYNSDAWKETFEVVERGDVAVGVHHADDPVVEAAREIMDRHDVKRLLRFEGGEAPDDENE